MIITVMVIHNNLRNVNETNFMKTPNLLYLGAEVWNYIKNNIQLKKNKKIYTIHLYTYSTKKTYLQNKNYK